MTAKFCWKRRRALAHPCPLTSADPREMDEAASRIQIQGERLPEAVLKFTNG